MGNSNGTVDPEYSLRKAAAYLGMSRSWLEARCKAREIRHTVMGNITKLRKSDLDAYRAAHTVEPVTGGQA
jgi:excisionase family DNA binding protein